MSFPSILFGICLSILFGAAFHLWRGGGLMRFLFYITLAMAGFWAGQFIASTLSWTFDLYGDLHLLTNTVLCFAFLGIGYWLSPRQESA
jgi:hypothetical protein